MKVTQAAQGPRNREAGSSMSSGSDLFPAGTVPLSSQNPLKTSFRYSSFSHVFFLYSYPIFSLVYVFRVHYKSDLLEPL